MNTTADKRLPLYRKPGQSIFVGVSQPDPAAAESCYLFYRASLS
jgi:hypothetical protein